MIERELLESQVGGSGHELPRNEGHTHYSRNINIIKLYTKPETCPIPTHTTFSIYGGLDHKTYYLPAQSIMDVAKNRLALRNWRQMTWMMTHTRSTMNDGWRIRQESYQKTKDLPQSKKKGMKSGTLSLSLLRHEDYKKIITELILAASNLLGTISEFFINAFLICRLSTTLLLNYVGPGKSDRWQPCGERPAKPHG